MKHSLLRGRRGAAMGTALLFMVVLATFSLLLLSAVTLTHSLARLGERQLANCMELEQVGEYFRSSASEEEFLARLNAHHASTPFAAFDPEGGVEVDTEEESTILRVCNQRGRVILYIENNGGTVIRWQYSAPTP